MKAGDELAPLEVPITATLIVAGAIASADYMPVHHDAEFARASGAKDVFMNIFTTGGLVSRFVTDHTGPDAWIRAMRIRLGVPNYPGDTMTLTGRITSAKDGVLEIEVRGANSLGDHVTGTVEVQL